MHAHSVLYSRSPQSGAYNTRTWAPLPAASRETIRAPTSLIHKEIRLRLEQTSHLTRKFLPVLLLKQSLGIFEC
jgi:hypothetical protein